MFARLILTSVVSLTAIGSTMRYAQAQEAETWQLRTINFMSYGSGIKQEYRNKFIPIEVLYSTGASDGIGDVAFVCAYGSLNFRIQVEPGDIISTIRSNLNDSYEGKANPRRTFRPEIHIDGEKSKKMKWIEGKQDRVVMPLEFKSTAQLYNAVIQGGEVRFTRKKKTMILNLPAPNADFKDFGDSCLRNKRQ